jgi:hypothetical protein
VLWRRGPQPPGPDWQKTEERFVDPSSGETLDVWFHPTSGERAYVRAASRTQQRIVAVESDMRLAATGQRRCLRFNSARSRMLIVFSSN